jgi:hypothetical protein
VCDAVKPPRQSIRVPQRTSTSEKDEKRRLKRIIGVGCVGQHPAARTQDHRTMASDDLFERRVFAAAAKGAHKLGIRSS